jgi:hypothetical protein
MLTLRQSGAEREKETEGKGAGRPLVHRGKSESNLMKRCSVLSSDWLTFGVRWIAW